MRKIGLSLEEAFKALNGRLKFNEGLVSKSCEGLAPKNFYDLIDNLFEGSEKENIKNEYIRIFNEELQTEIQTAKGKIPGNKASALITKLATKFKNINNIIKSLADVEKEILNQLRNYRVIDKEIASKAEILKRIDNHTNINKTYEWLFKSITSIKASYPDTDNGIELFETEWKKELKKAEIMNFEAIQLADEKDQWGFYIRINLSRSALEQLKQEAKKGNRLANRVLDDLQVETLKRRGKEYWAESSVLNDGSSSLTGNYWVLDMIKKLNKYSREIGGKPFDIGDNKNQSKDTFF